MENLARLTMHSEARTSRGTSDRDPPKACARYDVSTLAQPAELKADKRAGSLGELLTNWHALVTPPRTNVPRISGLHNHPSPKRARKRRALNRLSQIQPADRQIEVERVSIPATCSVEIQLARRQFP
jgi:hypothetical protein